jgi:hypothetical protein
MRETAASVASSTGGQEGGLALIRLLPGKTATLIYD